MIVPFKITISLKETPPKLALFDLGVFLDFHEEIKQFFYLESYSCDIYK